MSFRSRIIYQASVLFGVVCLLVVVVIAPISLETALSRQISVSDNQIRAVESELRRVVHLQSALRDILLKRTARETSVAVNESSRYSDREIANITAKLDDKLALLDRLETAHKDAIASVKIAEERYELYRNSRWFVIIGAITLVIWGAKNWLWITHIPAKISERIQAEIESP